ncbi:hypothetical protein Tco_1197303, partial [Tanacetum coccineum]
LFRHKVPSVRGSNFSFLGFSGSFEFSINIPPTSSDLRFSDFLASIRASKIRLGRSKPIVITKARTRNGLTRSFLLNASAKELNSRMTFLCEISTSRSQEYDHANQRSIIESLPVSPIPVEDSDPVQEEIDIFLVSDDLIPPGVENDDFKNEDNELPNLDHQDDPLIPRPPPKPPDVEKCLEPEAGILITKVFKGVDGPF